MRSSVSTVVIALTSALLLGTAAASATTIQFENYAPAGSTTNVNPGAPYTEGGFTLTPMNSYSAVFDSAAGNHFPGDSTDWLGFVAGNTITLTGPTPFTLVQLLGGPFDAGPGITDLTITGVFVGGGSSTATWTNLTTATTIVVNWSNLASVTFGASTDSALDDIVVTPPSRVPEPLTLSLLAAGMAAIAGLRRRKKSA